jgi:hypothetical protein
VSPPQNWRTTLAPVARLLGRGVIEQLFARMALDPALVMDLAKQAHQREEPGDDWSKLTPKQRGLWQQRVETIVRAVGQRILD